MNLSELKSKVDMTIESVVEYGDSPNEINVWIQIDVNKESIYSGDVELHYDNDCQASGCVLVGLADSQPDVRVDGL